MISTINELEINISAFTNKNIDVFTGIGQFPDLYNLELVGNYQSEIVPQRRVPLVVKERYSIKLKLLIDHNIADYIDKSTDWTNNFLVIEKPYKFLRICLKI